MNYCEPCIIATTPGVKRIRGNGDLIYEAHRETPKIYYTDLHATAMNPMRDQYLLERAKECRKWTLILAKYRRNAERFDLVKAMALDYGILEGKHISWGYDMQRFDEYFGEIDGNQLPHGEGVKFYSDGTVYFGEWQHGLKHTANKGVWSRPDGLQYEGQWYQDLKHGKGAQTFPDGSRYTGEFAKGYEHGQGFKTYPDGSRFDGRFRFGKRDGLGTLTSSEGKVLRKSFKDGAAFHEPSLERITEGEEDEDEGGKLYFEPSSLADLAIVALGKAMVTHRHIMGAPLISRRLPAYLKPIVGKKFLETISNHDPASVPFIEATFPGAFQSMSSAVVLSSIRLTYGDTEALIYLNSANVGLKHLQLTANRLDSPSLDMISKLLLMRRWPHIESIDLSCNKIDVTSVQNLITGLGQMTCVKRLKLAICKITASGTEIIAKYLTNSTTLEELDLSFNAVQAIGADMLAKALAVNSSLHTLKLRQNNIGTIGGQSLADALRTNRSIRLLNVADNKIGTDIIALIAARLAGGISCVAQSVCASELIVPPIHQERKPRQQLRNKQQRQQQPIVQSTDGSGGDDDDDDDLGPRGSEDDNGGGNNAENLLDNNGGSMDDISTLASVLTSITPTNPLPPPIPSQGEIIITGKK